MAAGQCGEIVEFRGSIEQFQFPLDDPPDFHRHLPSGTCVLLAKEINRRLVGK
jgi:hypothetical protein